MADTQEITRDESHSYYQKGQDKYPPVTSIINLMEQDTTGLEIWRGRNDGEGDNADWEHLFWYARQRGTLSHYEALNPLADRELWGHEESQSMKNVIAGPEEDTFDDASHCLKDITYSVMANHYYDYPSVRTQYEEHKDLFDVYEDDVEYFTDNFEWVKDELGITEDSVIAVEQYVIHEEYGYGGQADLVYEDPDGKVVLADLKTSSGLRQGNLLQGAAYKRALEDTEILPEVEEVHREEVIRINADKHDVEVHSGHYPEHLRKEYGPVVNVDWYDTTEFYDDEYNNYSYESMDEIWAHFYSLVEQYHDKNEL